MEPVLAKMRSKPALSLRRLLLLVILFALPLAACNSGDECETRRVRDLLERRRLSDGLRVLDVQ
jgi:hypothetical protein